MSGVVITGASTGIGKACALYLDARGFRVFAGVRRDEDGESLRRDASERLTPVKLDVTDADSIATAAEQVGDGELAGLVNNAGIGVGGPLELLDVDDLRRQLEVNSVAPVVVTQAFLPRLRESRGRVVNMSSVGGRMTNPFMGPYHASKYALEALSDALRRELMPWGIHVALIEPGSIKTPLWDKADDEINRIMDGLDDEGRRLYGTRLEKSGRLVRRIADAGAPPEKVARAVHHALTSERPRARYVVGADARAQLGLQAALPTRALDRLLERFTS